MTNDGDTKSSLGNLSSGDTRYQAIKMSPRDRKRKALFEDFRSRIISANELKAELVALND